MQLRYRTADGDFTQCQARFDPVRHREVPDMAVAASPALVNWSETPPDDASGQAERGRVVLDRAGVGIVERMDLPHKGRGTVMSLVMRPVCGEGFHRPP